MRPPLLVEVTRGDVVEAAHVVHAVAVRDDEIVGEAGDAHLRTYLRSSAKPLQALPLVRARPDLGDREIAIACASHLARPEQLEAVRALLAAAPAGENELETGPDPTPIEHNCSGKHAGFLAVCRARGWPTDGYRLPGHPLQQEILAEVSAAARVPVEQIPTGIDGCGVPTFGLALDHCARLFARIPQLEGGDRVVAAMRAHPELLRGPVAADVKVIRALPGWFAKGGAEGLFCACHDSGLAVALKVEDGSFRAILPALAAFLRQLGIETGALGVVTVENSRGETVGSIESSAERRVPKRGFRV